MTPVVCPAKSIFLFAPLLIGCALSGPVFTHPVARAPIRIPHGRPITIDGKLSASEWSGAATLEIRVSPDWSSRIYLKHDSENLYLAFENLERRGERLFPEILLDPRNRKSGALERGQWWLHVSNNLCEGNGEANVYTKNGVFQCAHQKSGWAANNPPTPRMQVVEARISFAKLDIQPSAGACIGLAFDLTDATGDAAQKWFFWPLGALLSSPKTWSEAVLE